ncbi:MAG TPA: glycosyltransferase N-terminal domain-containing protein [Gemmatimonas sp.]|uniref:3-deoxy-D-manno-octulosonic acid transferase n=1 Tax=Gemmatimonas sp. TaxID=1962908 RepID=UPI002ED82A3F
MHPLLRPFYSGIASFAAALTPVADSVAAIAAPRSSNKLLRTFRVRRRALERWEQQCIAERDRSRPLVWMHAPSVGEGLQARPVAHALKARHPDWQLAYSWFSPSAESFASSIGADLSGYLPFDTVEAADRMLKALEPSALVFAKLDIWPALVERAMARSIPVALISGTVAPRSGRRSPFARALLGDAYRALSAVGAIDDEHGARLIELGVRPDVLHRTGDTRFDQVWTRAQRVDRASPMLRMLASDRATLVAGSTWPADEQVLLPAWKALHAQHSSARLIIAPHEPTAEHVDPILAWARTSGLRHTTLSELEQRTADQFIDVIVVDRVGVLGDLYALATAAFVGGGFHAAGLHSVIEPAAFGAPVIFGPRHDMSREAGLLLAAGGGAVVTDAASMQQQLNAWLFDKSLQVASGASARHVVEIERGATERSAALIEELVTGDWAAS